jgi:hypothetical protein
MRNSALRKVYFPPCCCALAQLLWSILQWQISYPFVCFSFVYAWQIWMLVGVYLIYIKLATRWHTNICQKLAIHVHVLIFYMLETTEFWLIYLIYIKLATRWHTNICQKLAIHVHVLIFYMLETTEFWLIYLIYIKLVTRWHTNICQKLSTFWSPMISILLLLPSAQGQWVDVDYDHVSCFDSTQCCCCELMNIYPVHCIELVVYWL